MKEYKKKTHRHTHIYRHTKVQRNTEKKRIDEINENRTERKNIK